ncbi:MAG: MBOAT family protein [Deltaproteobacteria bacterium]|jgi:D-alanyl-lipoteichoic acid acyltransferase DltB (MBOAT superfamily)|nr:MBOAT family protein [Deltaproteobacteria bacterium]
MPFTSLDFAVFFGFALVVNWRLRARRKTYPVFLLIASLIFYSLGAPKFLPLLVVVALANHQAAVRMREPGNAGRRKLILVLDIVFCLSLLAFFKYFEFLLTSLESLGLSGPLEGLFRLPQIVYPVGLSFFTFQGLSLAIDHYRDPGRVPPTFLETMLFVSFFPTVLSGPIQRSADFFPQLKNPGPADFNLAIVLVLTGLFKKITLSGYLSEHVVRGVFQVPESYSALGVLAGIYGYGAQIYLDFSGYSDMARGVALFLGFDVGRNFDAPYLASDVRDFWRRWHVSLSSWLRDYLYIPLGGSKKGSKFFNLLLTQTLGGLWHGAHLKYLVWGFGHGLALGVTHLFRDRALKREKAWRDIGCQDWRIPPPRHAALKKWGGFLFTFNFVSFMWILFRADTFERALSVARLAFDWSRPGDGAPLMAWLIVLLALFGQKAGPGLQKLMLGLQRRMGTLPLALWCAFWVIMIIKTGPDGVLPFIYFQY